MNARNIVLTLISILVIIGLAGCTDSTGKYTITVNRSVRACGTDDPTKNVAWLADYCTTHTPTNFTGITISISVYANKVSGNNSYVMSYSNAEVVSYSSQEVYDCSGQKLFFKGNQDPAPAGWTEFFAANDLVAIIWELKKN
jgi:hypothetical protein